MGTDDGRGSWSTLRSGRPADRKLVPTVKRPPSRFVICKIVDLVDLVDSGMFYDYSFESCRIRCRLPIVLDQVNFEECDFNGVKFVIRHNGEPRNPIRGHTVNFFNCILEDVHLVVTAEQYNTIWRPAMEGASIDTFQPLPEIKWD